MTRVLSYILSQNYKKNNVVVLKSNTHQTNELDQTQTYPDRLMMLHQIQRFCCNNLFILLISKFVISLYFYCVIGESTDFFSTTTRWFVCMYLDFSDKITSISTNQSYESSFLMYLKSVKTRHLSYVSISYDETNRKIILQTSPTINYQG